MLAFPACRERKAFEEPLHRLVDREAHASGRRDAPSAAVADVTRYVLAELPSVRLSPAGATRPVRVGAAGEVELEVSCPPELAGQRLVLRASISFGVRAVEGGFRPVAVDVRHVEEIACPAADEPRLRVRVQGLPPEVDVVPAVVGYRSPPPHAESDWLTIPEGARLRVAIGIASPGALERASGSRFRIAAEDRRGRVMPLATRMLFPETHAADRGWVELEVALDGARLGLGPEMRIVFDTEPVGARGAFSFPAWGDPTIVVPAPGKVPQRRRGVILVSLDTLRADRLGCYGFPAPTSPNLDALAARGTLFSTVIAPADWTLPSHATMLTGVNPCVHGLHNDLRGFGRLPAGVSPLAEILRREGYSTAAFTEDAFVAPVPFQRGFGLFSANSKMEQGGPVGLVEDTVARAVEWLGDHAEDEFFLFVHTYQVHAPYTPPARHRERLNAPPPWRGNLLPPSAEAADDAAAYAAEVRYTDETLGALFAAVERLGLAERTIVVVTSDHGEAFGEHGTRFHGQGLYEEELRVPLIWWGPGVIAAGRRVPQLVGLVDVAPTLLDLLGIARPEWMQGSSLAVAMRHGKPPGSVPAARVLPSEDLGRRLALRTSTWKAIYDQRTPAIFFIGSDPGERSPSRQGRFDSVVRRARQRLDADCKRFRALVAASGGVGAGAEPPPDPAREQKLRALGYVQ